ncbi:MAG: hypothetical protein ACP5D7_08740 [Limnospira sp.]
MGLERKMFRGIFDSTEVVQLRQRCFTPSRIFEPGSYIAGELPDIAFDMGLVEKLPSVRGNSAELDDPNSEADE